jgi:hypothetical protein
MQQHSDRHSLRILHLALCAGCAFFLLVIVWVDSQQGPQGDTELSRPMSVMGYAALGLVPIALLLFRKRVARIPGTITADPLHDLRAALILHWALIEAACFFNGIVFMLSGSWAAYTCACIVLAVLLTRMPTDRRIDHWLMGQA